MWENGSDSVSASASAASPPPPPTPSPPLDCPEYTASDEALLDGVSFWVEGVLQCALAAFGVVGNTVASVIISRKEMRNSFNLLLVSLACFDSTYLVGSILESVRKTFGAASRWHIALFPHVLYPFNQVAITGSIFMTVAIAWERYVAVHYPLDYNQAMNDSHAVRKRLVKYVGPVFALALLFNVVKFLEADVEWTPVVVGNDSSSPMVYYEPSLAVAEMRTHPVYTAYNNWSRLLVLGIVPFFLLVFFNTKIYNDIVERRRRRLR